MSERRVITPWSAARARHMAEITTNADRAGRLEQIVVRYFFFSYVANDGANFANGNIWMAAEKFPSHAEIKSIAENRNPGLVVVVTGWKEFSSKDDFDAFTGA